MNSPPISNGATSLETSGLPSSPLGSTFTQATLDVSGESAVVPPDHPARTLVLAFDGTGDQFDSDNSNIVQLFSMLLKSDRSKQMVYYQAGIGTYTTPQIATPFMSKISKFIDEAIAWNLDAHVMGGYEFLMQNYNVNDRICIFGFSRGAYTARSLAGMIHKVGLLPADNHQQIPFAYKMYSRDDETGWKQSNAFKKTFSIDVDIEFVGVWDTVNSVGLIPRRLPFTTSNTIVRTFRHAVSLDERRSKFKPNLWHRSSEKEKTLSISDQNIAHAKQRQPSQHKSRHSLEQSHNRDRTQATDVDEVWFAGCHCDVGGGSVDNETMHNLARIPLRWMIRECFKTNTGIMFSREGLRHIGLDPNTLYPYVAPRPAALPVANMLIQPIPSAKAQSKAQAEAVLINFANTEGAETRPPSEEELDRQDALCPIYDQLTLAWFWWILELLPIKEHYQRADNTWATYFGWNLGRGRAIPPHKANEIRVHRSVKTRLDAQTESGQKYKPKAGVDLGRATWVD